jgi:hypothetical protein
MMPRLAAWVVFGLAPSLSGCHAPVPPPSELASIDPPALAGAMGASLAKVDDSPVLSWLEPAPGKVGLEAGKERWRLRVSRFSGSAWSAPVTVTEEGGLFANWADFPAVASIGHSGVAHWLAVSGDEKYAYSIALAGSTDGGATWRPLGWLPTDRTAAEHGFVSWLPESAKGALRAFWLDGRGMPAGGPMTLRSARVDPEHGPAEEELLDDRVCDCCQTDAAITSDGPIVVYRDRSAEEIRDIAIRRLTPTGWSAPALVHADGWHIEGCPVNGPAVAASNRRVAVAWFTGAPSPRVLLAFSEDSGATFSPPILLDTESPLGRVDLVLDRQGSAIVSWLGQEPGTSERSAVRLQRVSPSAKSAPAITLATTSSARASGFPRLLLADDQNLMVAWTEPGSPGRLRAARVGLRRLGQAAP